MKRLSSQWLFLPFILGSGILLMSCQPRMASLGSLYDSTRFFKEAPSIVYKDSSYAIRFRYAQGPNAQHFFMMLSSKIKDDSLIFYLPCTSSSGWCDGKVQLEPIVDPAKKRLIRQNKAFFLEPDKSRIQLMLTIQE